MARVTMQITSVQSVSVSTNLQREASESMGVRVGALANRDRKRSCEFVTLPPRGGLASAAGFELALEEDRGAWFRLVARKPEGAARR